MSEPNSPEFDWERFNKIPSADGAASSQSTSPQPLKSRTKRTPREPQRTLRGKALFSALVALAKAAAEAVQRDAGRRGLGVNERATIGDTEVMTRLVDFSLNHALSNAIWEFPMYTEAQITAVYDLSIGDRLAFLLNIRQRPTRHRAASKPILEETSPWQENAIKDLEEDR